VQVSEVSVKVCRVVHPCQSVNARCSPLLQIEEGPPQNVDADVMQERCQLLLLVPGTAPRMRACACVTASRLCVRTVLCSSTFLLVPSSPSTDSAADRSALFASFAGTIDESDFFAPFIIGYGLRPSRCGPGNGFPRAEQRSPGSRTRDVRTCSGSNDDAGWPRSSR